MSKRRTTRPPRNRKTQKGDSVAPAPQPIVMTEAPEIALADDRVTLTQQEMALAHERVTIPAPPSDELDAVDAAWDDV